MERIENPKIQVQPKPKSNMDWFFENFQELYDKYPGQLIAIKDGRLIAHAITMPELIDIALNGGHRTGWFTTKMSERWFRPFAGTNTA